MQLYSFFVSIYYFVIRLGVPFHPKARLFVRGRKHLYQRSLAEFKALPKPCIWFHCASMGEYQDGKALIELVKQQQHYKLLITFTSPSGYEHYAGRISGCCVSYLPYDRAADMQRFIHYVQPQKIILCRNDLWPNLVHSAWQQGIPLYLADYSYQARWLHRFPFKPFYKKLFSKFSSVYVQNVFTQQRLSSLFGLNNLVLTGNTRFDALQEQPAQHMAPLETFTEDKPVLIFGSALAAELQLLQHLDPQFLSQLKLIVVEHVPSPHTLQALKRDPRFRTIGWAELQHNNAAAKEANLLYIEVLGLLPSLYFYAQLAVIGGGFNSAGTHNLLEPAVAGNYIAFGPNHRGYQEALDLLKTGDAGIIRHAADLNSWIETCLKMQMPSLKNKAYVMQHRGAARRCFEHLFEAEIRNGRLTAAPPA